ncbi:WDGH domain-containing protein [Curtobacterium citreum]
MTYWVDRAVAAETEVRRLQEVVDDLTANPRDEHHTMAEVYQYRMLYNALAVNAWAAAGTYPVVKSWTHSDGEPCFGGGWFIVVATLPTGQVSNHYRAEHWDLFKVPEGVPPSYDGHTPAVAADRMLRALQTGTTCTTAAA